MLALGVIEESLASHWSQLHILKKLHILNAATRGLEQTLSRLGTLKLKLFGLLNFTAGCDTIRHVKSQLYFLEDTVTPILDYGVGG